MNLPAHMVVLRSPAVPLGAMFVVGDRAVVVHPLADDPSGARTPLWSRYTLGEREARRDRRRHPRTHYVFRIAEEGLRPIPEPDLAELISRPRHDDLVDSMLGFRRIRHAVISVLGESNTRLVAPELLLWV